MSKKDLQGYLAHKKSPPPWDHHRALSIGLLKGPRGGQFLMGEVPLYEEVGECSHPSMTGEPLIQMPPTSPTPSHAHAPPAPSAPPPRTGLVTFEGLATSSFEGLVTFELVSAPPPRIRTRGPHTRPDDPASRFGVYCLDSGFII